MKLISLNYLLSSTSKTFLRFPASILSSLLGVCVAIYLVEEGNDIQNFLPYINLMLCAALGIPLFFSVAIITERSSSKLPRILGMLGAVGLLVLIYFSLPSMEDTHNRFIPYIRYGLFNVIVHLLVSFVPYLRQGQFNGFWNYNKSLFIRIITSGIYSGVLYSGLMMALLALVTLFNVDIDEKRYFELWIVITGLFNTWFFLAGIPHDLDSLEDEHDYPKGLKVFTQYILLPLLLLYLVILYSYGAKIVLSWDWPKGIVSYMIAAVSVLGMFTMLLIHPYSKAQGNEWIKRFTNIYYFTLFPLIALLFFAIWLRVDDYGITVNRYAIILLGIWLTIIAGYFALLRGQNIKFIPISLAIMLGLSSFGPWGMFSIGERSQVARLEKALTEAGILKDGKIMNETIWTITDGKLNSDNRNKNDGLMNDSTHNEVLSILNYLDNHHGFKAIRPWFEQDVDSLLTELVKQKGPENEAMMYMQSMGLDYTERWDESEAKQQYFNFTRKEEDALPIEAYQYMTTFELASYQQEDLKQSFTIDGHRYRLIGEKESMKLVSETDTLNFQIEGFVEKLTTEYADNSYRELDAQRLSIGGDLKEMRVTVVFNNVSLTKETDKLNISNASGFLFFSAKGN